MTAEDRGGGAVTTGASNSPVVLQVVVIPVTVAAGDDDADFTVQGGDNKVTTEVVGVKDASTTVAWDDAMADRAGLPVGGIRVMLVVVGASDAGATMEGDCIGAVETDVILANAEVLRGSFRVTLGRVSSNDPNATMEGSDVRAAATDGHSGVSTVGGDLIGARAASGSISMITNSIRNRRITPSLPGTDFLLQVTSSIIV